MLHLREAWVSVPLNRTEKTSAQTWPRHKTPGKSIDITTAHVTQTLLRGTHPQGISFPDGQDQPGKAKLDNGSSEGPRYEAGKNRQIAHSSNGVSIFIASERFTGKTRHCFTASLEGDFRSRLLLARSHQLPKGNASDIEHCVLDGKDCKKQNP